MDSEEEGAAQVVDHDSSSEGQRFESARGRQVYSMT
jgi:hypothetical protein